MKILSFGAGMQSTALALMSCENADAESKGRERPHPLVPVYDLVVFCDLGFEPPWVMQQAEFVHRACDTAGIRYEMLDAPLHRDLMQNFGRCRTVSIPWWTLRDDGHKSRMPRNCTLDYKVERISKFVRWLGSARLQERPAAPRRGQEGPRDAHGVQLRGKTAVQG